MTEQDHDFPERRRDQDRRRSAVDRRLERGTGLQRRRSPGRRRTDFAKAAKEGEMTREQFLVLIGNRCVQTREPQALPHVDGSP